MNPGGEPERDDTGLPPVDIEIPDDARELDRDVQAYYRELRADRRRRRRDRWHASLARDGIVLPLLACCLILALIAGTLLTVFSATTGQTLGRAPGSGAGSAPAAGPRTNKTPQTAQAPELPDATITVAGRPAIHVRALSRVVLVLIPPGCACGQVLSWLTGVAASAHATATYLIATKDTAAEVGQLYQQLATGGQPSVTVAAETDGKLQASAPTGIPAVGLTAILVGPSRLPTYATDLSPADDPSVIVRALTD